MPCALDDLVLEDLNCPLSATSNVVYRPFHALSGYRNDSIEWRITFEKKIKKPDWFELDFKEAAHRSWASLGFPRFDELRPQHDSSDLEQLRGWRILVSFTAMRAYPITRGMW